MKYDNFKYVGEIDTSKIVKKVDFMSSFWEEFDYRQNRFKVHQHTQTIPILFDADFRLSNPTPSKWYPLFEEHLRKLKELASKFYGDGFIIRCILTNLKANKNIAPHIDKGSSLHLGNRVHIPIITSDKVLFTVGEEEKNMKVGEMWEINNGNKIHAVYNNSDEDRVHLIFDYIIYRNSYDQTGHEQWY